MALRLCLFILRKMLGGRRIGTFQAGLKVSFHSAAFRFLNWEPGERRLALVLKAEGGRQRGCTEEGDGTDSPTVVFAKVSASDSGDS